MESLQIKLTESVVNGNSFPELGGLNFNIKNPVGAGPFNAVANLSGVFTTPVAVTSRNGFTTIYHASSGTDISTSGKTAITSITAAGYYLFVTAGSSSADIVTFKQVKDTSCITGISQIGCTVQNSWVGDDINEWPFNKAILPNVYSTIYLNNLLHLQDYPEFDFSEMVNSEMIFNLFNMASTMIARGTFTSTQKTAVEASGIVNYLFQFGVVDNFNIDLSNVPSSVSQLQFIPNGTIDAGTINITCSGLASDLWIKTKPGQKQLIIQVPCASGVLDKLLIAASENPVISFVSNMITLKGVRTSASDAALAILQSAGITVNIVAL